jgi:aryl-alcohol dehydrogenase-like predicted oxidoreductase
MRMRALGASGPPVSALGLGCNNFGWRMDQAATTAVVDEAVACGINFFDTADVYGDTESERLLGRALGSNREHVVIGTKFGIVLPDAPAGSVGGSRDYVRWAVRKSLRRLGTDWIDLYQYHRPDGVTPIEETIGYLAELQAEGLIGAFGVSNFEVGQLEAAAGSARARGRSVASVQNRFSVLRLAADRELLAACAAAEVGLIPFSPLESGLLTGRFRAGQAPPPGSRFAEMPAVWPADKWLTPAMFAAVERLEGFAAERGLGLLDVAIGWLAGVAEVGSVIAGASRPEQVRANAAAVAHTPTAEDLGALRALFEEEQVDRR